MYTMEEAAEAERAGRGISAALETSEEAVEVVVRWGESVLHVAHLSPPRDVVLGDGTTADDVALGVSAAALGLPRLPLVTVRDGRVSCTVPDGASGGITAEHRVVPFSLLESEASPELASAESYPVPAGARSRIEHRGFTFEIRPTVAARRVGTEQRVAWRRHAWVGVSFAVHMAVLAVFALLPPHGAALSLENLDENSRLIEYRMEALERVEEPPEPGETGSEGESAPAAADDSGQAGEEDSARTENRFAIRRRRNAPPELSREQMRERAAEIGAIGALRAMLESGGPISPDGGEPNGSDLMDAVGALLGDQPGSHYGHRGLGPIGTGLGGGGDPGSRTIGTRLGTCRDRGGCGRGPGVGDGWRPGRPGRVPPPTGRAEVVGNGLSPEAVRRVIRRHLNEVRHCYEQGLQRRPDIEGRVTVNWVIYPDGSVSAARVTANELGDPQVGECVAQAVRRWQFPGPSSPVGVNFPFRFRHP